MLPSELERRVWELEAEVSRLQDWHDAVLRECMRVEGCYIKDAPYLTLQELINWHVAHAKESPNVES